MSPEHRAHLQAYGVIPGYEVRVVQHKPVTVVQIEHTELALEAGVAGQVWLELS
jgi:Fe2+ transport system protein FeoA